MKVVADDLGITNETCLSAVKQSAVELEALITDENGPNRLDSLFKLCDPIDDLVNSTADLANFFSSLAYQFASIAQYDRDNNYAYRTTGVTLATLCNIMTNETIGTAVDRLAGVNSLMLNTSDATCLDYKYDSSIVYYKNVSWDSAAAGGGKVFHCKLHH